MGKQSLEKVRKLTAWNTPFGDHFLTKPLSRVKWALRWTPKPWKNARRVSSCWARGPSCGAEPERGSFPKHSPAPEKAVAAAFPSKHPSCHFPFFLDCLFLPSAATHNSTLNQFPLTGQVLSSPHGNLWHIVGFGHFPLPRPFEIPDASTTARVRMC